METPVKMQASSATTVTAPAPASSPVPSQSHKTTKRSAKDYIFGKLIGDGCYSTVFLAKDIHTGKEYASKCTYTTFDSFKVKLFNFIIIIIHYITKVVKYSLICFS